MRKKFFDVLMALVMTLSIGIVCLAGCGEGEESSETPSDSYTVTFDVNYEGGENITQSVKAGEKATAPEVERSGFGLLGWYTDEELVNLYDFGAVTEDITVYADWKDLSKTYYTVTYNYNNGEEAFERELEEGKRVNEPEQPEWEGYVFYGWYSDAEFTEEYVFGHKIEGNVTLYARWATLTAFEAEDINFRGLRSPVYSGTVTGTDFIVYDRRGNGASNGYYVMGQYAKDGGEYQTTLEFHINATEATSDATLYLRLSAAYGGFTINGDTYQVSVNGTLYNYSDITFENAAQGVDSYSAYLPFEDYLISSKVNLKEGDNVIKLIVNNSTSMGGTTKAFGPCVDCIKVATADGELSWGEGYPVSGNYDE